MSIDLFIYLFWDWGLSSEPKRSPASPLVWQTAGPEGFAGAEPHVRWCTETVCVCVNVCEYSPADEGTGFCCLLSLRLTTLTNKRREACRFHLLVSSSCSLRLTLTSTHSHRHDAVTVNEKGLWKCKKKKKEKRSQTFSCRHKASRWHLNCQSAEIKKNLRSLNYGKPILPEVLCVASKNK